MKIFSKIIMIIMSFSLIFLIPHESDARDLLTSLKRLPKKIERNMRPKKMIPNIEKLLSKSRYSLRYKKIGYEDHKDLMKRSGR